MQTIDLPARTAGPATVVADLVRPSGRAARLAWTLATVVAGSLLVAASARIAMPLPFTPVPVSMQSFAVLLVGALLGPRRGAASLTLYLAQGAVGLPVFVGGGGLHMLLGPTGGYLFAFVPAAALVGLLAGRGWDRGFLGTAIAMSFGSGLILLSGTAWLAVMFGSIEVAVVQGLLPFLPGAIFKIALAAAVLPAGWWWLSRFDPSNSAG